MPSFATSTMLKSCRTRVGPVLCSSFSNKSERPMVRMSRLARFGTRRRTKIGSDKPLVPGFISPRLTVPPHIARPPYADTGYVSAPPDHVIIHDEESIARMRAAGQLARKMLDLALSHAKPGVAPDDIDQIVHQAIIDAGAYPSPLNYMGFPKSMCSSVNESICHGIPDDRPLLAGDLVSFDVSCFLGGVHGDNCGTVLVGEREGLLPLLPPGEEGEEEGGEGEEGDAHAAARALVRATQAALDAGVAACRAGGCLSDIGAAIQEVADALQYETVRKYCGHGIAEAFHIPPLVQHFRNDTRMVLHPGMIFTIEPMLVEGSQESLIWNDGWNVVTVDGGRAAQFEHTILITDSDQPEILTVNPDDTTTKKPQQKT